MPTTDFPLTTNTYKFPQINCLNKTETIPPCHQTCLNHVSIEFSPQSSTSHSLVPNDSSCKCKAKVYTYNQKHDAYVYYDGEGEYQAFLYMDGGMLVYSEVFASKRDLGKTVMCSSNIIHNGLSVEKNSSDGEIVSNEPQSSLKSDGEMKDVHEPFNKIYLVPIFIGVAIVVLFFIARYTIRIQTPRRIKSPSYGPFSGDQKTRKEKITQSIKKKLGLKVTPIKNEPINISGPVVQKIVYPTTIQSVLYRPSDYKIDRNSVSKTSRNDFKRDSSHSIGSNWIAPTAVVVHRKLNSIIIPYSYSNNGKFEDDEQTIFLSETSGSPKNQEYNTRRDRGETFEQDEVVEEYAESNDDDEGFGEDQFYLEKVDIDLPDHRPVSEMMNGFFEAKGWNTDSIYTQKANNPN